MNFHKIIPPIVNVSQDFSQMPQTHRWKEGLAQTLRAIKTRITRAGVPYRVRLLKTQAKEA